MAVVTLTVAAGDELRVINAIAGVSQLQPGAGAPLFPTPVGANNAATIKSYLTNVLQQLVLLYEERHAGATATETLPVIT
jgi:hypothetical protein